MIERSIPHAVRLGCLSLLIATAVAPAQANLIVNGGFEADAVFGAAPVAGATGWTFGFTGSSPGNPAHTGIGSLLLPSIGSLSVPVAYQTFAGSAGQTWDLSGYIATFSALALQDTFAMLKIVFSDGVNDLEPAAVHIGAANTNGNPGIESSFLDASSPVGVWQFAQANGVAPVGTTQVRLYALFVDGGGGTVAYDDLSASAVPEPSTLALYGAAGLLALVGRRRQRSGGGR